MFELDPLFTRTFLLALPLRDIATVLQRDVHIPLHEVAWTVTRVAEESLPDEEVVVYLSISLNRRFLSRQHHLQSNNTFETLVSKGKFLNCMVSRAVASGLYACP